MHAHGILTTLYRNTADIKATNNLPQLRNIVLPAVADDASDSEDDDGGSNDQ
jgi:hypothetical protein